MVLLKPISKIVLMSIYIADEPKYAKKAQLFEVFKKAFKGIVFNVKSTKGDINEVTTKESSDMNSNVPIPETIQICGSGLLPIFDSFLKNKIPSISEAHHKIVKYLKEYVDHIIDDNDLFDENEDESLLSLDENYHWTERCAGFDADDILNEIIKKLMAKKKKK